MIDEPSSALQERFTLLRRLGQGGYGVVYEALDRSSGQRIALKQLTAVNPLTLAHFKREFRAMQEVHHPNLVRLDALIEDQGNWLIAMELVEGYDLLKYTYLDDPPRCFDERRLRDAFVQLAEGLMALHAAGFVHRDLKPANVRVTRDERVVLLDFGLATGSDPRAQASRSAGLGTLSYMAPEQADRHKVGPSADFYAFGVCLHEALCGVLPIEAPSPLAMIVAKRHTPPSRPSRFASGIPEDLDDLCESLLQIEPAVRPDGRTVRSVLGLGARRSVHAPSLRPGAVRSTFEGRDPELSALSAALDRARAGQPQVMLIEGDSGIGKTSLVEHFCTQPHGALVLRSRCYESESLAYKAFDGAIYELCAHLNRLPRDHRFALMPDRAALLRRLFTGFESVDAVARAPLHGTVMDAALQRSEAFAVFTRLLARLSIETPLLFVIDDLQWADAESFALLQAVVGATGVRCLSLATVRPRAEVEGDAKIGLAALRALSCVRDLPMLGLPQRDAMALARALMGPDTPEAWLERIVAESAGHPLFLTVLIRFAGATDPRLHPDITLELAIAAQIGQLTRKARRLFDMVVVAGAPLPIALCGRASGVGEEDLGRVTTELCQKRLLRRRAAGQIACFHDRIRSVAAELIEPERHRRLHAKLASVLAKNGAADPAELARHYEAAGELAPACEAYKRGAERAQAALAFSRAAQLYGRAFALWRTLGLSEAECNPMRVARAHALSRAGHGEQAAQEFLQAAQVAHAEEQTQLRILGAQHLLQSACVQQGLQAAHALLSELDLPLPGGHARTLARMAWDRAMVRMRGLDVVSDKGALGAEQRMQLEALWGLSLPMAWLDTLQAAALTAHHLRVARTWREPTHLARALAEEAFMRELLDADHAAVDRLLARTRVLCDSLGAAEVEVRVAYREATVAALRCDWPSALAKLEHSYRVATERCPDQPWLLSNVRVAMGPAWLASCQHEKLAASMGAWLSEARDRDDRFALSLLQGSGAGHILYLMQGEPERANASLQAAMAPWPREPFALAHLGELTATAYNELYRGGDGARVLFERERARLSASPMLKTPWARANVHGLRALACLSALRGKSAAEARALQLEARGLSRELERGEQRLGKLLGGLLGAQLAALASDRPAALQHAAQALQLSERCGHRFIGNALRYLQGLLQPGEAGAALRGDALALLAREGWRSPVDAIRILVPAIDMLQPS